MNRRTTTIAIVVLVVIGVSAFGFARASGPYTVTVAMKDAAALTKGSSVLVDGTKVGKVESLRVRDGMALADVSLDGSAVPLHTGTTATVRWRDVLGEREIELTPGPTKNPEIPSGGMIRTSVEQVNVDDLLAALDSTTRAHVSSLLQGLNATLAGQTSSDMNATLQKFGPAVEALAELAKGLGEDGPAIRALVTDLDRVVGPMAQHGDKLSTTVSQLTSLSEAIAREQGALSKGLAELPTTLAAANRALVNVGPAVDEARPLLRDLQPVTAELPSVSAKLAPTLEDARPAMASLRGTLGSADTVLGETPGLLDNVHAVSPGFRQVVSGLNPALQFLRPYTPDLMGWISNWASGFSTYDTVGGYAAAIVRFGYSSFDENPGIPLTQHMDQQPPPGMAGTVAGGTAWTDANGSGMQ